MSKRQAYDVKFKMEVIEVAEKSSNREAGSQFKIDVYASGDRTKVNWN